MISRSSKKQLEIKKIEQYWAPKVRQNKIRTLYLTDAKGIVDEEQIDDVGYAFYARCRTIYIVTECRCPECEAAMEHKVESNRKAFVCSQCGWRTTWGRYHKSYKGKRIHGGGAYPAFPQFMKAFRTARTPRDKMVAIDHLIHALHERGGEEGKDGSIPGAVNVIEGTLVEVFEFLEELGYPLCLH